jgi:hypothetical protein
MQAGRKTDPALLKNMAAALLSSGKEGKFFAVGANAVSVPASAALDLTLKTDTLGAGKFGST